MKVMVTTRRAGTERHLVVEGPPGVSTAEVLRAVTGQNAGGPARETARLTHPVRHGDDLPVGPWDEGAGGPPWLVVAEGPDAGLVAPLPPGRWVSIGRDPACDLSVDDPALSRLHLRVRLERSGVRVEDMGSTNGIEWESGGHGDSWAAGDRLLLGSSSMVLLSRPPAPAHVTVADGHLEIAPWPRESRTVREVRLHRPPHPERRQVRRPSVWSWGLPLAVAVVVALILRMPWLLMFGLLGPAMVLGQHLAERRSAREEYEEACLNHRGRTRAVEEAARVSLEDELRLRRDTDGGLSSVTGALACGDPVSSTVWACLEEPLRLVVGTGAVRSEVSLDDQALWHGAAPVVVTLDSPIAVVGPRLVRDGVMRSLLLQLAGRHPPDQVTIAVDPRTCGTPENDVDELLAWLPHTVVGASTGARSSAVITWGQDLMLLEDPSAVPVGATLVMVHSATRAVVHGPDGRTRACAPTLLGRSTARCMVRRLAPLRTPAGPGLDAPALRSGSPGLSDVVVWPADVQGVLSSWDRPGLDVVLGVDPAGAPVRIDLVRDGPHALVAGTTGSGKSELLRTLVAGLALRCSPADLTLLLVDYKGGSSLGDCARLPHVTGLVTDLDPHLAERMLVSLQAELTRRESVLHAAGARDLDEYSGDGLPRLVVVIDEFRVLAEEVPEVLTRLVRLAAVGRSLGVHLILATQRPAGVVSADLRANVNLRIALRVRDAADSHDVLDCGDAAALPEGRPGLALLRTGPETPRRLQVSRLTRPATSSGLAQAGALHVREHRDVWSARRDLDTVAAGADDEDTMDELVSLTQQAAARAALEPPVVWLPPLPGRLGHGEASPAAWAVLDRPDEQRRDELVWSPTHHLGVVGSARSGRSTALRSVLTRLQECWTVVLDLGRGLAEDDTLRRAPACCAWVGPDEAAHGLRVLDLLEDLVRRRQTGRDDLAAPVVVAIDGWDRFVDHYGEVERGRGVEVALRLMREGPAVGVVALVTGDRSLLVGRLAALLPQTWALPLNDPSDLLLTGLRSTQVPRDRPPGRIVGVRDGVVGQVVLPAPGRGPRAPVGMEPPLRVVALPARVSLEPRSGTADPVWAVGGDRADPLPAPAGSLLVLGPPGSGRSWTLDLLAALRQDPSLRVEGTDPPTVDDLRKLLGDAPRGSAVVVDDAHLLAGTAVEDLLLDHAASRGADLVVAADLEGAAGSFRGLVPVAARARCAVVLQPDTPAQGSVVGVQLPVGDVRVPGRGVLVHRGRCTRLQVVSPRASP